MEIAAMSKKLLRSEGHGSARQEPGAPKVWCIIQFFVVLAWG